MIANVSPCESCCEHTLNSLRYADRVKELKKENREKVDPLMLPRNGLNTVKIELKKQHSYETNVIKGKNLPVALQRHESLPVSSPGATQNSIPFDMNRLKSAKPKPNPSLSTQKTLQASKSPRFKPLGGIGGAVSINSNTWRSDQNIANFSHSIVCPNGED